MKNEIVKIEVPELSVIEKSKAEQIRTTFEPMAKMLAEFEETYNKLMSIPLSEMTLDLTQQYKRLRLDIGKIRIETGKIKDKQKEYIKLEDKAIMGIHNILVWAVKEKEDNLKKREDHYENIEKAKITDLQEKRQAMVLKYEPEMMVPNLGEMEANIWVNYIGGVKLNYEARNEAEKKAEVERIEKEKAEKAEQERIMKENEQLKKEAKEKERLAKIETEKREQIEVERIAKQQKEQRIREEKERKERAAYAEKLRIERVEKERLESELKAKKEEAELKLKEAKEEEEARIQAELSKGDAAKIIDLIIDLKALKGKYTFKSKANQKKYSDVGMLIDKVINHINK